MTPADLEARLRSVEHELAEIRRQLAVLSTGIALARWLGPFAVSLAAVVIVAVK